MCYLWILSLTVIGVSAIDVKSLSPSSCVVKVELKERMINVVNKDELCSCLKYEKATLPPLKILEPCHLSTFNSGGNLMISADSICECAGYQTNITHKLTTESDISYLTTASTATGGTMSSKSHRVTVKNMHTDTPTGDTVEDTDHLPDTSGTEVLNLTHTTDVTTETTKAKTDTSKNLTTSYTFITVTPVVSKFKNSSKINESGTTEKIEQSKPTTTERNKSTTLHLTSSMKIATTDTNTDIKTPVVILTDTVVTKITNETVKETVSLKDIIQKSTSTTESLESTTKEVNPLDVKPYNASDITKFTERRKKSSTASTYHSSDKPLFVSPTNSTIKDKVSVKDIMKNSTNTTKPLESTTATKEVHPLDIKPYNVSDITNFTELREKTSTVSTSDLTDKSLSVLSTNETIKEIVSLKNIIRNSPKTTESTESTSVTKEMHSLDVKPHDASHITNDTDLKEKTSEISLSHTITDKSVLVSSEVTSFKAYYTRTENNSSSKGKSSQKAIDGLESTSTKNEKELTESTFSVIPIKTKVSFNDSLLGNKTVIPISTASNKNVDTTNTDTSKTHTPKYSTNKMRDYTKTEVIWKNYNGTEHTKENNIMTTDEEKADVIIKDTSNTTPTTQTTAKNSSNAESGAIEGNVFNSTNITLIAILTTICIVLLILFIARMINSCFRKGSYVLPHVSDGNIEMECKK